MRLNVAKNMEINQYCRNILQYEVQCKWTKEEKFLWKSLR